MTHDPYTEVYKNGVAVGHSNVRADTMTFRFKDETFEFPAIDVIHLARFNGYFYEAAIDDLRRLEAEAAGG